MCDHGILHSFAARRTRWPAAEAQNHIFNSESPCTYVIMIFYCAHWFGKSHEAFRYHRRVIWLRQIDDSTVDSMFPWIHGTR